jgi:hypothetical protein
MRKTIYMTTRHTIRARRSTSALGIGKRGRKKQRLTFTLSGEAVEHIRALRARGSSPSLSATVERLIESNRRAQKHADLRAGLAAYYDSFSEDEARLDNAWGAVGEAALAAEAPAGRTRKVAARRSKRRAA